MLIGARRPKRRVSNALAAPATIDPISYSETDQPTKVGYRRTESGRRERYAKVSGAAIPLPEEHLDRGPKDYRVGPLDTEQGDVERETFQGFDDFGREVGIKDWGAVHFVSAKHEEKGRS